MSKNSNVPPPYSPPPPSAPPSYAQAVGGVPPSSPFIPNHNLSKGPQIVTTVVPVGPHSTHTICPHCHAEIDTTINSTPSMMAWIAGAIICLIGCPLGCCLIPCCLEKCRDVHHICPNCSASLGEYRR